MKRGGGRRYYRPEDVDLLRRIRSLLYEDGYTIKGVQKLLRETASAAGGEMAAPSNGSGAGLDRPTRQALQAVLDELESLRDLLRGAD